MVTWDFDDGGLPVTVFNVAFTEEGMVNPTFSTNVMDFGEDSAQLTVDEEDELQARTNYTVTVTGENNLGVSEEASFFYTTGTYVHVRVFR